MHRNDDMVEHMDPYDGWVEVGLVVVVNARFSLMSNSILCYGKKVV